ncbi:MAG TPA: hypothetical protein VHQ65_08495 [Thermoanaerobaculia bacterium]|nr:hypothetical protein [Thermoanaerobaculia bacterium]
MSRDFALVPLDCPSCGAGVAAEADDVVFYCTACRSGYAHRPGAAAAAGPLVPVPVTFLAAPTHPVAGHLPFWWLPARLEILRRAASGAVLRGLVDFLTGREEQAGPRETGFAIPAHRLPLARTVALAMRYTMEPPARGELLGERLTGAVLASADAEKLAHYVLIASNVAQSDTLQDFEYDLRFGEPRLLGVPWVTEGNHRVDAFFRLPI